MIEKISAGESTMLKLQEELKKNALSRYHLLYGEERYMVRYYKKMSA